MRGAPASHPGRALLSLSLPEALRIRLDQELDSHGYGRIEEASAVGGGCIAETRRLRTSRGASVFLKWMASDAHAGLLDAEADALERIASTRTLRVPHVVARSDGAADGPPWLLLEWLEPGSATPATWHRLGTGLAALHRTRDDRFGCHADNFIGTLPQNNASALSWAGFWREQRLRPQLDLACASGSFGRAEAARFDALFNALDDLLSVAQVDGPSLLHGDLWSGNLHVLQSGEPALIDPSAYFGHREVDVAMTQLFGGFDPRFLRAYDEAWPLEEDFEEVRRPIYQLYYLLVHVNLFGGSYRAATLEALRAAGF